MTKAIVTYAAGAHEELLDISLPRFQEFAGKHGYSMIVGNKLCDRPPAWNKVPLMIEALQYHDEVLWLDADLVIVNTDDDIKVPVGDPVHAMVRHFSAMSEVPNSGVWLMRKAGLPLLEKIWQLEVFWNHGWWEQAALMTLMGYTVPPEGSLFDETKCRCVRETEWTRLCHFMKVEWNSHPNYRAKKARIVHCSYPNMRQRIDVMRSLIADSDFAYPEWDRE